MYAACITRMLLVSPFDPASSDSPQRPPCVPHRERESLITGLWSMLGLPASQVRYGLMPSSRASVTSPGRYKVFSALALFTDEVAKTACVRQAVMVHTRRMLMHSVDSSSFVLTDGPFRPCYRFAFPSVQYNRE